MPNLEKLFLWEAKHLLKESSESRLGTVLQLKELVLSLSGIKDIGFEREPVLRRLELLSLFACKKLRNLAPPSVSVAYLTNLNVKYCNGLRNLKASSTAKSLVQLKSMKISGCDELEEIVSNEGNKEEEQIAFGKLITIELEWLGKLKSFCSYKNCEFKFPSLEVLIVRGCRIMQRFTEGGARAPKLQNIVTANEEGKEEAKWQWKGDLNATIQKGFNKLTPNIEHLTLGEHELNMILSGEFQGNHLNELKVLALFFHFESDVFLQRVPNIEKLEVCDGSFKETFCFDSLNVDEAGLVSQLKVICSDSLTELVSIGSENSGIVPFLRNLETLQVISCLSSINLVPCTVSFSNLTYLLVQNCKSLLYLFTSSTARSLGQLKTMEISGCDSMEEIVSEEGDESDEDEIIFQQLNCLELEGLRKLRRFYKGSLSFPSLREEIERIYKN